MQRSAIEPTEIAEVQEQYLEAVAQGLLAKPTVEAEEVLDTLVIEIQEAQDTEVLEEVLAQEVLDTEVQAAALEALGTEVQVEAVLVLEVAAFVVALREVVLAEDHLLVVEVAEDNSAIT